MNEDEIKVSVIIPVYQVENYLERAVESVLAQTLREKEIILVDDGSTDASPEICDRYAAAYPDFIRVIHKENEGLGLTRNAGVQAARGKYIGFLDSDDSVEPEMYERLFDKAEQGPFDIVMCDVKIIYVDENKSSIVSSYPEENIDLADYIANGNNITYSVNKLYKRSIWKENRYEKMLFEDIALVPALLTRCASIGYVPQPFYHYYRRANTISTTMVGSMVDIVQAFRNFIDTSNPIYREEVIYCVAKQVYWNMFQSRTLFQADFILFLKEYEADFRLNPYLEKDKKYKRLLEALNQEAIPENIICVHFGRALPEAYLEECRADFPKARLILSDEKSVEVKNFPPSVQRALAEGNTAYAEEYVALWLLYREGGIVIKPEMRANLQLKRLRLDHVFFGFEDDEELNGDCYGAIKGHYVIKALLQSYEGDSIFNQAFLPLKDRIREILLLRFGLRINGRTQLLRQEVRVYLPSVLSYDMQNGENCCKHADIVLPDGMEAVSAKVLKMWSNRILENWNLYKQEKNAKQQNNKKSTVSSCVDASPSHALIEREIEQRVQEIVKTYENSTCWRITKPLRAVARLFGKS